MNIRIGYDLTFDVPAPAAMIVMLYVHPERAGDLLGRERIITEPEIAIEDFTDAFGNRCGRLVAPAGTLRLRGEQVIRDSGELEPRDLAAPQVPVQDLPFETLQFLLPSRYCEVDRFSDVAWKLFGSAPDGWPRVQTICDWVHAHTRFDYTCARPTMTAWELYNERAGVCRDFTHLAITFCRCMNIPARYATGYLGDIGVPPDPNPMDFAAFMEVYLGNRWWPVDVRHNARRIGRVLMARGRDAVDVALTTSFGATTLTRFKVTTEEIGNDE
jgi:transglutaminase-like putative cysteine protease